MKLVVALLALAPFAAFAQKPAPLLPPADPAIQKLVDEISAKNLEADIRKLVSFGTRHTLSDTQSPTRGIGAARNWVRDEFLKYSKAGGGRMTVEMDTFTVKPDGRRINKPVLMANVLATLPGTDPTDTRVILVSGHIDSRVSDVMNATADAPGANDDGSGTVLVMELARVLAGQKFPCTLKFVAVQGEEQGLYGSGHLAERAKKEGWNLVAMLNNDIVGNSHGFDPEINDATQVRVFSEGVPANETAEQAKIRRQLSSENDAPSRQLARFIQRTAQLYGRGHKVALEYRPDRFLRGGDHTPFNQQGFAAVRFTEMNEDFTHQHQDLRTEKGRAYGDLPEGVDYAYLRRNAGINLATMAALAKAPAAPAKVEVLTANLTNRTELRWQAPAAGPKPSGYVVLVRETSAPQWQQRYPVAGLTADLPISKDNFIFGVASIDAAGHESVAVLPVVGR
ncbi:M20/M25/M40 family metallo-hydrolase [Hymenobacter properus]|uniref:M20/M25/M40 family metallo-hydrolase n=1 Tax=Hymenobacter properus TaxID=2791026 RepID=A0A931BIE1_9BACT|nr:M20/M25/M40 family metallo-hydrolase [Hymenobacter properus]MBF9144184.1 M20/M25/M40 family metallo-hydrolase [Hymenobacter properus]MBR7723001.1 M20/M25/M40 family metallo-hydrolase [Microvirga sp. SRT04]